MNMPNPQHRLLNTTFTLSLALFIVVSVPNIDCQAANIESCNFTTTSEVTSSDKNYELPDYNTCTPNLKAKHQSIFCLDYANNNLIEPAFDAECGTAITQLSYTDEYINLNCSTSGFEGYFAPAGWTISKIYGDGGVDVTGAPNITLVEGANKALVEIVSGSTTTLKILVPANGIATFDWSNFGGSTFFYSLLLNGKAYPLARGEMQKGSFRTPVMGVGDVLEFQLKATEVNSRLEISNFHFYSNATGLVKRHWLATDESGNQSSTTQLISIEKANLSDVILPANRDDLEAPVLSDDSGFSPDFTGYPFIDRDGDLSTTDDQYGLENGSCTFDINWTDKWTADLPGFILERRWTITDWCNNSTLEGTQIIKLDHIPTEKATPPLLREFLKASDLNYEQLTKPITGLKRMVNPGGYGTAFRCKTKFFSLTQTFPSLWDKLTVAATFEKNLSDAITF